MKEGSNTEEGRTYQDIPGSSLPYHRGNSEYRGKRIGELTELKDKEVLDLGCNVGTLSNQIAQFGAYVTAVDYDLNAIMTGRKYYPKVDFHSRDITLEYIKELDHFDIVLWLSQFMWIVKQHGMDYALDCLWELSRKCDTLIFETAGLDGMASIGIPQEQIVQLLLRNTCFQDIRDTGPWTGGTHTDNWPVRNVFVCSNPFLGSENELSKVELFKRGEVKKTYIQNDFAKEVKQREVNLMREFSVICPQILSDDEWSFTMNYEGPRAQFIPNIDLESILTILESNDVTHRDIRPENILWNGVSIKLIDFAWMVRKGEITNYSHDLGGKYKCPYGFNDEYSLRKVQKELL